MPHSKVGQGGACRFSDWSVADSNLAGNQAQDRCTPLLAFERGAVLSGGTGAMKIAIEAPKGEAGGRFGPSISTVAKMLPKGGK